MIYNAGDFAVGQVIPIPFNTVDGDGAATDLSTDGSIAVYDLSNLSSAVATSPHASITFSESVGSNVGMNMIAVDTSNAAYVAGKNYGVAIVGAVVDTQPQNAWVGVFSTQNRYAPGLIAKGYARAGGTTSQILFPSAFSFSNNVLVGATANVSFGKGYGNSRIVVGMTGDDADVSPALSETLDTTSFVEVYATSPAPTVASAVPPANITHIGGNPLAAQQQAGYMPSTIKEGTAAGEIKRTSGVVWSLDASGAPLATTTALTTVGTNVAAAKTSADAAATAAGAAETAATAAQTAATAAQTAVSTLPASTVTALKADAQFKGILANSRGNWTLSEPPSYPGNVVMTLYDIDGVTVRSTHTLFCTTRPAVLSRTVT